MNDTENHPSIEKEVAIPAHRKYLYPERFGVWEPGTWERINKLRTYDVPARNVLKDLARGVITAPIMIPFGIAYLTDNWGPRDYLEGALYMGKAGLDAVNRTVTNVVGDTLTGDLELPRIKDTPLIRRILREDREPEPKRLEMQVYGHRGVIDKIRNGKKDSDRKVGVLILGGGQAGNNGAGVLLGMQDNGAWENIDGMVGVSAGVPCIEYGNANQGELGAEIFRIDNTEDNNFIKLPKNPAQRANYLRRILAGGPGAILDTMFAGRCMREKDRRPLDVATLKSSEKELLALVMDVEDGSTKLLDIRKQQDPIATMEASVCVPGISTVPSVKLEDGRDYADAFYANPIPLEEMRKLGYTDILIIANNPLASNTGFLKDLQPFALARLAGRRTYQYQEPVVNMMRNATEISNRSLNYLHQAITDNNPDFSVAVIEPKNGLISAICDDRTKLTRAFHESRDFARNLFRKNPA